MKKNNMTSKEYLIYDETRQTEFQAHIFKIPPIIVERFPVYVICVITTQMQKPHTVVDWTM